MHEVLVPGACQNRESILATWEKVLKTGSDLI